MKNLRTATILAMAFISLTVMSCKESKKDEAKEEVNTEMNHDNSDGHHDGEKNEMVMTGNEDGSSEMILENYFNLKNALVADDNAKGKELGATLAKNIKNFDISEYTDAQKMNLKDIIEDAV